MLKRFPSLKAITRPLDIRPRKILGCTKINNLYLMSIVKQDVLWLEVAMHDLVLVVDDGHRLQDVTNIVSKQRFSNDPVKF